MTAVNESTLPRKRIATYGKAARKRLPDNTTILERCMRQIRSPPITLTSPKAATLRIKPAIPSPPPRSTASSDLSNESSSYDVDDTDAAPKRRKMAHGIFVYGEKPACNTTSPRTSQRSFTEPKAGSLMPTQNVPVRNLIKRLQTDSLSSRRLAEPPRDQIPKSGESEDSIAFLRSSHAIQGKTKVQDQGTGQARGVSPEAGNVVFIPNKLMNQGARGHDFPTRKLPPSRYEHRLSSSNNTPTHECELLTKERNRSNSTVTIPKGTEMWNGLLGKDYVSEMKATLSQNTPVEDRYSKETAGNMERNQLSPRKRLIDSLHEKSQSFVPTGHSSPSLEEEVLERTAPIPISTNTLYRRGELKLPTNFQQVAEGAEAGSILESGNQASQASGPKITYSHQRSILVEQDIPEDISFSLPLHESLPCNRRHNPGGSYPFPASVRSLHMRGDADEEQACVTIRTIHELRQAGANRRFIDAMEDLLDRIENPSTRRSGLLDLAQKMEEKDFHHKFFSNGMEHRLYPHLEQERDVISGFLILSLLITLLDLGTTPMAIVHRLQGMNRLLVHLLDVKDNVIAVAKDRRSNMSKYSQMALSCQVQSLLSLRVWKDLRVESASPRTVALRFLELLVRQSRKSSYTGAIISSELTEKIFSILKMHSRNGSWDLPTGQDLVDIQLALSTLESHSLNAVTNLDDSTLVDYYLPIVRSILESTLKSPSDEIKVLQVSVVRLTLNATNNSPGASDVFATPETMHVIGQALVTNFNLLSKFMTEEERIKLVDHLVLMSGVMMNFAECSVAARRCFHELKDSGQDPLDDLVNIFVDNLEKTFEVG
jgi:hypothetical protein